MAETPILKRYAEALFAAAAKFDKIDKVYEDLKLITDVYIENPELDSVLNAPVVSSDKKKNIMSDIFSSKIDALTLNFLFITIDKKRNFIVSGILEEYECLFYEDKSISTAVVESAIKLDDAQIKDLKEALEKISGRAVVISENIVNELLVGGLRVTLGDDVIDGSVSGKIRQIREFLLDS